MSLLVLLLLAADPLPVEKSAAIERDQQKAQAEVAKKYGNKKPSELSSDERREMTRDLAEADQKVLDKHGVDPKAWARESIRKGRDEYAQQKDAVKKLDEKEKAEAEKKAAEAKKEPKEITIQKGFNDENPVVLEEKEGGEVVVEKGLPPEAADESNALSEYERLEGMGAAPEKPAEPAKPTKKSGKGGKRR